jgi:hypothetical protein
MKTKNTHKILVGKPLGKHPLGRPKRVILRRILSRTISKIESGWNWFRQC